MRTFKDMKKAQASTQASYYVRYLTKKQAATHTRYLKVLESMEFEELVLFSKRLFNELQVESFVNGNLSQSDSIKLVEILNSSFQHKELATEELAMNQILQFTRNTEFIYQVQSTNGHDENSAVLFHFQVSSFQKSIYQYLLDWISQHA